MADDQLYPDTNEMCTLCSLVAAILAYSLSVIIYLFFNVTAKKELG